MDFVANENALKILINKELEYELPYLWIRDNCPCNECRVEETQEKRFMLNSVPVDLRPRNVDVDEKNIQILWPDGHETSISFQDIKILEKPRKPEKDLWSNNFIPSYYDWDDFLQNNDIAIDAISDFSSKGSIGIKEAPCVPDSLEDDLLKIRACLTSKGTDWLTKYKTGRADDCTLLNKWKLILVTYLLEQDDLSCLFNCANVKEYTSDSNCHQKWVDGGLSTGANQVVLQKCQA